MSLSPREIKDREIQKRILYCADSVPYGATPDSFIKLIHEELPTFNAVHVSTTLHRIAKISKILEPVEKTAFLRNASSEIVDLTNILKTPLFKRTADEQSVTNSLWALAILDIKDEDVLSALCDCIALKKFLKLSKEPNISTSLCLWCLGTLGYKHERALEKLCSGINTDIFWNKATTTHISNSIWGLGSLGYKDNTTLQTLTSLIKTDYFKRNAPPHDIASSFWALASLDPDLLKKLWPFYSDYFDRNVSLFNAKESLQVFHAGIIAEEHLPSDLIEKALAGADVPIIESPFEKEVGTILTTMNIENLSSGEPFLGFYPDFTFEIGERSIVLECDGVRYHYIGGDINKGFNAGTRVRNQVFEKAGYETFSLSDTQWAQVPEVRRKEYLNMLLGIE